MKRLTLVLGGASSGKSAHAESLVIGTGLSPVYIATARAYDAEMEARIKAHRAARAQDGWRTVEEPEDLAGAVSLMREGEAALIDCATLWLSNLMLTGADLAAAEAAFFVALDACPAPVVVVSNEVGFGIVPDNALARAFRDAQGGLNQRLAQRAGRVIAVMAGLPLVLK